MSGPESVDGDDIEAERGWETLCRGDWRTGNEEDYDYTAYDGENV